MLYGYARISKPKQSIERQIRNIKANYPDAAIISEAYTGTTSARPKWAKLVKQLKEGDTVVFDSVSRMSRNAEDGFADYEDLYNKGVSLVFLKEPQINTATYKTALSATVPMTGTNVDYILEGVNRFLMELAKEQIRLAFEQAKKEVTDLHQRTKEGIVTAKMAGKQIGRAVGTKVATRKSKEAKKEIEKYSKDFCGTMNDKDLIRFTGLARNTYYKYKKELREEKNKNQ